MRNKKKWWNITILVVLFLVLAIGIVSFFVENKKRNTVDEEGNIVKDNVITLGSKDEKQPVEVKEKEIIFSENPRYKKGDVLVSDVTAAAPEGFLRKVKETERKEDGYHVKTEPATLTDVFEVAHVSKTFKLTEEGSVEISQELARKFIEKKESEYSIQNMSYQTVSGKEKGKIKIADAEEYEYGVSFEEEIGEGASVSGEMGFTPLIIVKFDIDHGEIDFGMSFCLERGGAVSAIYSVEEKEEFEKELYRKALKPYTFWVSGVPIVLKPEVAVDLTAETNVEGELGAAFSVTAKDTLGFEYSSKTGKVKEIRESSPATDGIEWNASKVSCSCGVAMKIHLAAKLYGVLGPDIAAGISGTTAGELQTIGDIETAKLVGKKDSSIAPIITGEITIDENIVHENLQEQELFELELSPIWEEHWESSADWKGILEQENEEEQKEEFVEEEIEETTEEIGETEESVEENQELNQQPEENQLADTHYENEYFSIDVPQEWVGYWEIEPTENTYQKDNPRVIAAYMVSHDPEEENSGGGAIIHVLKMEPGDRLGYGFFGSDIPQDAEFVEGSSDGIYIFIMTQAGGGFFFDGGATITGK